MQLAKQAHTQTPTPLEVPNNASEVRNYHRADDWLASLDQQRHSHSHSQQPPKSRMQPLFTKKLGSALSQLGGSWRILVSESPHLTNDAPSMHAEAEGDSLGGAVNQHLHLSTSPSPSMVVKCPNSWLPPPVSTPYHSLGLRRGGTRFEPPSWRWRRGRQTHFNNQRENINSQRPPKILAWKQVICRKPRG